MTIDQTANFVRGDVSASVGSGDTTISVDDASIYPDPSNGNYNLVIWDAGSFSRPDQDADTEVVRVTARDVTNNNLTVTRAQEGTTAVSHPSSSELQLSATAKVFTDIDTKIDSELTITGSNGLSGGSSQLGGSIDVGISGGLTLDGDLTARDGETIWNESATYIPTAQLQNDSMTIAGNSVSLGGSTAINHSNLSNISSDDHHQKYTNENAQDAVGSILGSNFTYNDSGNSITLDDNFVLNTGDTISGTLTATGTPAIDAQSNIRLATGQAIEDGSGTARFFVGGSQTEVYDDTGARIFSTRSGIDTRLFSLAGQPLRIKDDEGGFTAMQYFTSASSPGTLSLDNAQLELAGNKITSSDFVTMERGGDRLFAFGASGGVGYAGTGGDFRILQQDNTVLFKANAGGPVEVQNASLDLNNGPVSNVSNLNVSSIDSNNGNAPVNVNQGLKYADTIKNSFGSTNDFSIFYESSTDELVVRDEINSVDLIRQPKQGSTQFLQGIDAGAIEAPVDSFTQLANASVTSSLAAGDRVGYTFALDNQTFLAIDGEADGSGGIQNTVVNANGQLQENGTRVGFTFEEGDGESRFINSGERAIINGGTDINTELTSGSPATITVNHSDTSSQGNVSAPAGGAISTVNLDARGHVTSLGTTDFDGRFVNTSGDTMSGNLDLGNNDITTVQEIAFTNIENPGTTRSIGVDDSEGPLFRDYQDNTFPLWNSDNVNAGTNISISGGSGAASTPITISHSNTSSQGNVTTGGATVIDDISLDGRGHVTNMNTQNRSLDDWASANANISIGNNNITNVSKIDGNSGDHRIRFDSSSSWIEITDQSNNRRELVTQDVYVNDIGSWVADDGVFAPSQNGYEIQKNGTDGNGIINFKT